MSVREEVSTALSEETVRQLALLLGIEGDVSVFRERLVHVLTRYERGRAGIPDTPKKERRLQISRLQKKAEAFLKALDELSPDVRDGLEGMLDVDAIENAVLSSSFDLSVPLPESDDNLPRAICSLSNIIRACAREISYLDASRGRSENSRDPALDQLVFDLEATFDAFVDPALNSRCYRDVTSSDGYSGNFYKMTKCLLDGFRPGCYQSPEALGLRITRLLSETTHIT